MEGQEARPGEQHVGAAADVFGSVEHTKVTRARAFRGGWGRGGENDYVRNAEAKTLNPGMEPKHYLLQLTTDVAP